MPSSGRFNVYTSPAGTSRTSKVVPPLPLVKVNDPALAPTISNRNTSKSD
jgi:hypothetical protein